MQSPASTSSDRVQEVSLIDLALVFIRFKKVFLLVFTIGLLLAVVAALILPERYQYTTLMQLAEKASDKPVEGSEALVGWLQFSVLPEAEAVYRDEQSRKMPFELAVKIPEDTLLLKITSKAKVVDEADLKEVHQKVSREIVRRQEDAIERHVNGLKGQLASTNETIELLRKMDDPGAALSDALERKADLQQKIADVRGATIINVAQKSLERVTKGPVFVVVIGTILAGVLAGIVTLVWALFSHASRRMAAL